MNYIKNWEKQEDYNSSEVSKYAQLIFFRGLRRSVGAVRAPVDNHLLCRGGTRRARADGTSFILPRMLSLNEERSAECQALRERGGKLKPSRSAFLVSKRSIVVRVFQLQSDRPVLGIR